MIRFIFIATIVLLAFNGTDCRKNPVIPPPQPPPSPPDTTSHNFTFTTYTFGGNAGSSGFKDVTIIDDSNIWVVGAINPATDSTYNAVHWDGEKWNSLQIQFYTICGQSHTTAYPINTIFAFGGNDIWFSDGGEILHWIDSSHIHDCSISSLINGAINKIWGISSSNLYAVGNAGTIIHNSNGTWTKMESGTTIDLRDVWGSPDGSVVLTCGWSNDESQSILLKYDGTNWKTVWSRNGPSVNPYGYFVSSVWETDSLFLSSGRGVFRDTTQVIVLPWFPYRIRGSANNNIAVAGDEGMIWHWSGTDWKQLNLQSGEPLYSVAISKTMLIAVGSDFNIGLGAALIYIGKRQ
ncbi:MAG: hypothetical protein KGJ59_11435 [Bacteroidota bacterium]|nr:hypothetical protein [Bacteroidota bacterium]